MSVMPELRRQVRAEHRGSLSQALDLAGTPGWWPGT